MVYNDVFTCYRNNMERGRNIWRYAALDYLVESFRNNAGLLERLQKAYPTVEIIPVTFEGNQPMQQVSIEDALKWDYSVNDSQMHELLTYLYQQVNEGNVEPMLAPLAAGNLPAIPGLNEENRNLASEIDRKISNLIKENKVR